MAAVDVFLVAATLAWGMAVAASSAPWVAWINAPYMAWVTFATVLQWTVTFLNRG